MLLDREGLATPEPVVWAEERWMAVLRMRSLLITRYVNGRSLWQAVSSGELAGDRLKDAAAQLARIWNTLGQLNIGHGDMKATNFIVDSENRLWMIDLDSLRVLRNRLVLARQRRQDIKRFMRYWKGHPAAADLFSSHLGIA
jgi:tRNA A-37 threonylcarbamoyl transferase component Bud32